MELKNCPFCGDNNVKPYNLLVRDTDYAVACCNIDCGAEGPDKDTEDAAIKAWNTRADTEDDAQLNARKEKIFGLLRDFRYKDTEEEG